MRFFLSVIDVSGNLASETEMQAITAFNEGLRDGGQLVFAWGLVDPSEAEVIDNRGGIHRISPGPHLQVEEQLSGFWVVETTDLESARRIALGASEACNRKVELRQLH